MDVPSGTTQPLAVSFQYDRSWPERVKGPSDCPGCSVTLWNPFSCRGGSPAAAGSSRYSCATSEPATLPVLVTVADTVAAILRARSTAFWLAATQVAERELRVGQAVAEREQRRLVVRVVVAVADVDALGVLHLAAVRRGTGSGWTRAPARGWWGR